jgi:hypothetical protein
LTYAALALLISDLESNKISIPKQKRTKYYNARKTKNVKNPRLKMRHPIIQPRGQNH